MAAQADSGDATKTASAISDAVFDLHVRYYGKGPREATTFLEGDYAFCLLKEPFTPVEQTLIEIGGRQKVRDRRQTFEGAMDGKFKRPVERLTGRRVSAFMSEVHVGPDLAIEIYKFEKE